MTATASRVLSSPGEPVSAGGTAWVRNDRKESSCAWQLGEQSQPRQLEYGRRLLACHALEIFQECVERIPALQIVEQVFEWNAAGIEAWLAAHPLGIDPDDAEERMSRLNPIADKMFRLDRGSMKGGGWRNQGTHDPRDYTRADDARKFAPQRGPAQTKLRIHVRVWGSLFRRKVFAFARQLLALDRAVHYHRTLPLLDAYMDFNSYGPGVPQ